MPASHSAPEPVVRELVIRAPRRPAEPLAAATEERVQAKPRSTDCAATHAAAALRPLRDRIRIRPSSVQLARLSPVKWTLAAAGRRGSGGASRTAARPVSSSPGYRRLSGHWLPPGGAGRVVLRARQRVQCPVSPAIAG